MKPDRGHDAAAGNRNARGAALVLMAASALAIGVAYGAAFLPGGAPAWAAWLLAAGTGTILVAATALGALQGRSRKPKLVLAALLLTWLIVLGGFGLALALPDPGAAEPLLLGLPRRAAIILYGIGLLPVLLLPVAYAASFDESTLTTADWERIRAMRAGPAE